jgi:type I restriction enzyme, S subunit
MMIVKKLDDLCYIEKGKSGIKKAIPGPYPLVVTANERLSHSEYQFDCSAVCIPLVSSTGHGHASIKRIHFQEGKFAVGSILAALVVKDSDILDIRYLYLLLSIKKNDLLVPLMKGTANVTLTINSLKSVEIHLPSIEEQRDFVIRHNSVCPKITMNEGSLVKQSNIIYSLKETILQLAVQGKLVSQDPNDEPASELLKRTDALRKKAFEKWINKSETIKINKKLSKISNVKVPYDVPTGWDCCALLKCSEAVVDCHNKTAPYVSQGIPILRTSNIRDGSLNMNNIKFVTEDIYDYWSRRCYPKSGDIIFTREAPMGEAAIIPDNLKVCLGQRTMLIRALSGIVIKEYLLLSLIEPGILQRANKKAIGATVKHLRVRDVEGIPIMIPPLAEQKRIVAKVDELMAICDQLETKLTNAQSLNKRFTQAVLSSAA